MKTSSNSRQVGGDHYLNMGLQPWTVIEAWLSTEETIGYLRGTALAYIARAGRKEEFLLDIRKAHHVLEELIRFIEQSSESNSPSSNSLPPKKENRVTNENKLPSLNILTIENAQATILFLKELATYQRHVADNIIDGEKVRRLYSQASNLFECAELIQSWIKSYIPENSNSKNPNEKF